MVMTPHMPAVARSSISGLTLPVLDSSHWTPARPASERRVSIVSSAGISRRDDKPFSWLARDSRSIRKSDRDLMMTHVAVDYDRTAWQQDLNAIFPVDRLEEMAADGEIGSLAQEHYSFMGATDPGNMEESARETAERMRQDDVNTVFLVPV